MQADLINNLETRFGDPQKPGGLGYPQVHGTPTPVDHVLRYIHINIYLCIPVPAWLRCDQQKTPGQVMMNSICWLCFSPHWPSKQNFRDCKKTFPHQQGKIAKTCEFIIANFGASRGVKCIEAL